MHRRSCKRLKKRFGTFDVQHQKIHIGSFCGTFQSIEPPQKILKSTDLKFVSELVPLKGESIFKPSPQNRILVLLRRSFQNFRRAPTPFHIGGPPGNLPLSRDFKLIYRSVFHLLADATQEVLFKLTMQDTKRSTCWVKVVVNCSGFGFAGGHFKSFS